MSLLIRDSGVRSRRRCLVAILSLVAGVGAAWSQAALAAERRPVVPIPLTRADGSAFDMATSVQEGPWLIVYVDPQSPTSGRLLQALVDWKLDAHAGQILVVLPGGDTATAVATEWQEKLGALPITIDAQRGGRQALGIKAIPTVLGARGAWVEWQVAGVLNDPEVLRGVITSWITGPAAPVVPPQ